ncbi:MAG: hypothetical protein LBE65_04475 [Synergistaceae bacterium]|nr:hypothetical protein [Synergistaceae bacterium]
MSDDEVTVKGEVNGESKIIINAFLNYFKNVEINWQATVYGANIDDLIILDNKEGNNKFILNDGSVTGGDGVLTSRASFDIIINDGIVRSVSGPRGQKAVITSEGGGDIIINGGSVIASNGRAIHNETVSREIQLSGDVRTIVGTVTAAAGVGLSDSKDDPSNQPFDDKNRFRGLVYGNVTIDTRSNVIVSSEDSSWVVRNGAILTVIPVIPVNPTVVPVPTVVDERMEPLIINGQFKIEPGGKLIIDEGARVQFTNTPSEGIINLNSALDYPAERAKVNVALQYTDLGFDDFESSEDDAFSLKLKKDVLDSIIAKNPVYSYIYISPGKTFPLSKISDGTDQLLGLIPIPIQVTDDDFPPTAKTVGDVRLLGIFGKSAGDIERMTNFANPAQTPKDGDFAIVSRAGEIYPRDTPLTGVTGAMEMKKLILYIEDNGRFDLHKENGTIVALVLPFTENDNTENDNAGGGCAAGFGLGLLPLVLGGLALLRKKRGRCL